MSTLFQSGKRVKVTLALVLALLLLAIPQTAQANSYHPVPSCQGSFRFCAGVEMAKTRLRATAFTLPWITWADEHQVLIVEHPEFTPGYWWAKVWEPRPTIWGSSFVTGSSQDASILVHEIAHLQDGPDCVADPFSHARVIYWQLLAAEKLGAPADYILTLYNQWGRYYREVNGRIDPCRR